MFRAIERARACVATVLSRFDADRRGTAAVEFALIVPVMFSLFVGTVEFSQALTVDRRVTQAAASSADLIARAPGPTGATPGMSPTEVNNALKIIEQLIEPYELSRLNVKVTSVIARTVSGNLTYIVDWSRDNLGAEPYARGNAPPFPVPANLLTAGESVIVAEATYNYAPLIFSYFITSAFDLKEKFFLKPRNGACVILRTVTTNCNGP